MGIVAGCALGGLAAAVAANAQSSATPKPAPDSQASATPSSPTRPSTDIVVTSRVPSAESSIDRKSYRISSDLQSAGGSATDVLRNLPSVDIDTQGNVSLRGDANVQILIDGKPSTTLTNANRGDALEQLPANTIDHVEVITNPSARFKADGSGGVINIVTRKDRKPGLSGLASASVGSDGRFNLATNATYRGRKITVSASATLHRDNRWRPLSDRRIDIDPVTGVATRSVQDSLFHGPKLSRIFTGGLDYDATSRDRISAKGSYNHRTGTPQTDQRNRTYTAGGMPMADFIRTESGDENEVSDEASLQYRHTFAKDDIFTLDLRRGETIENEVRRFTSLYTVPAGLVEIDRQRPRLDTLQREVTAEYTRPIAGGTFLAGYDLERDDNDFRNRGELIDPASGVVTVDPTRTNRFNYRQTVQAFYATYERAIARKVSAIFGLRIEQTDIATNQIDLRLVGRQSYLRAYPSLHVQYDLADGQHLKASFTNRVVRPDPEDLNPSPVFSDPLNLRAGNPNLKPQQTRAFELAYQRDTAGLSLEATAFLRMTRNGFTSVTRFISPTVLLTTKENLGRDTAYGLDLSASGKLSPVISYRLSGTLGHDEIDASNLGFAGNRGLLSANAKASIDLKLSRNDLAQISTTFNGRRLTPQGYRLPLAAANLGYRHQFHGGLVAVLSVADIFNSQRDRIRIDSATIVEDSTRRSSRRTVSVAISLPFGGTRTPPAPAFDYGN